MSIQSYALLDVTKTVILQFENFDSTIYSGWVTNSNPKAQFYLPVTITAQPGFNPATQQVTQNGWTINAGVDVEPAWIVSALSASAQAIIAGTTLWNTDVVASNVLTAANNAITNWGSLNATQKDTVLLDIVKFLRAFLQYQYGISS